MTCSIYNRNWGRAAIVLCFVAIVINEPESRAQDAVAKQAETPTTEEFAEQKKRIEASRQHRMQKFAASHSVEVVGSKTKVELYKKPIFFWSNPERATVGGAVHLWVCKGRPVATIGMWTIADRDRHEFQSLSEQPLSVVQDGAAVWSPKTAGLRFTPIPGDVSAPATSPARRLTQMRSLVRKRFSASKLRNETEEALRSLPQPIYRYEELPADVVDGAIFSFAIGTDPETIVIMEARLVDKTKRQWFYAFGAQTGATVTGKLDGKTVWTHTHAGDDFKIFPPH